MRVDVVYYGGLKERVGTRRETLELDADRATVADLLALVTERHPELGDRLGRLAHAVDDEIVGRDHAVGDGAELCLLPPVCGG